MIVITKQNMSAISLTGNNESDRSTPDNDEFDFIPPKSVTEKDEIQTKVTDYNEILEIGFLNNHVDHNVNVATPEKQSSANIHNPNDYDNSNIRKALSHMTVDDLDQFLNVYQVVTSSNPNIDKTIAKASVEQILSGQFFDGGNLDTSQSTDTIVKDNSTDGSVDDYTLFDVYDHIENLKKQMQPMISKMDDLAREYKEIVQPTTLDFPNVKKSNSNVFLRQMIKNNDDIINGSARYLSNINKYIETASESHTFQPKDSHHSQTDDDNTHVSNWLLNINKNNKYILNDNDGPKKITSFHGDSENQKTLLTPSNVYLETEYKKNEDELKVQTYVIG